MKKFILYFSLILSFSCQKTENSVLTTNNINNDYTVAPTGLKSDSTFIKNGKINNSMSWSQVNSSNYKSIKIYRGISSSQVNLIATLSTSETKFIDSNDLQSKTTYYYRISALNNKDIESLQSPDVIVTMPEYVKFQIGSGFSNNVWMSNITSDGKIICGGEFYSYNGQSVKYLVRLNIDGSIDTTFKPAPVINSRVNCLAIQPDGKIMVGGENGMFYRLNNDGSVDNSFKTGLGFKAISFGPKIYQIALNKDGSMYVFGWFQNYNSSDASILVKVKSDGSIDNSFDLKNQISGINGASINMDLVQSNGIILAGGIKFQGQLRPVFRINIDGTIDTTSFSINKIDINYVTAMYQQLDGKIIISGRKSGANGSSSIIRYNLDGSIDNSFNCGTGTDDHVVAIKAQSDGKILLVGRFTKYNNITQNQIVRLNSDGSIDNSFNAGSGFTNLENTGLSEIFSINFLTNGKILVTGGFIYYNNVRKLFIVLLNKDGTIADSVTN